MTNEDRDLFIARKLDEGMSLSDVQKALADECGVRMTYLDLRLLAADLEVDWKKHDKVVEEVKPEDVDLSKAAEPEAGGTKISVSKLVRPGAAISGDVEFASGAKADWYVDNQGRLGLNPGKDSSQPTEDDLLEFQTALQQKLSGGGV
ncbi:MAG: hypothetical protein KAI66_09010 [Lentisphaeria bacterium]|nr:hypothetical protein [Lentisphaeria bacterium]